MIREHDFCPRVETVVKAIYDSIKVVNLKRTGCDSIDVHSHSSLRLNVEISETCF